MIVQVKKKQLLVVGLLEFLESALLEIKDIFGVA